jgi:hypothetical protein
MNEARTSEIGKQLDEHHAPETNGRMAVCRRCGSRTDGPAGSHHTPAEHQVDRSDEWLTAQARLARVDEARRAHGHLSP